MKLLAIINRSPPPGIYRSCLNSSCDADKQHHPNDASVFECEVCNHKHCVTCQMPLHEGAECDAPELEKKRCSIRYEVSWKGKRYKIRQAHKEEEDATEDLKEKKCKKCPGLDCGVVIEKDG